MHIGMPSHGHPLNPWGNQKKSGNIITNYGSEVDIEYEKQFHCYYKAECNRFRSHLKSRRSIKLQNNKRINKAFNIIMIQSPVQERRQI